MMMSGPKIGWIMEPANFELADTNDAYRATGVSPSIGSWSRSVMVDPPTPLEAAMAEIELEVPRVVINPPIQYIRPRGEWFWGEGGFKWHKLIPSVVVALYSIWMMGWLL